MAYQDPTTRQPKGDHNRRLSLGLDPDRFAAEAGVTTEQLREYERTSPDHRFDAAVAERVGLALDRLEATMPNLQTGKRDAIPEAGATSAEQPVLTPDTPLNKPRYTA